MKRSCTAGSEHETEKNAENISFRFLFFSLEKSNKKQIQAEQSNWHVCNPKVKTSNIKFNKIKIN